MNSDVKNNRPVFIGGTGRSGTTILYDILGRHPEIFALKDEIRFIIDYNGLINLVDSLTNNYSPAQGGKAISEFRKLLLVNLTNKNESPYPGYQIQDYLGNQLYFEKVNNFIAKLIEGEFSGSVTWMEDEGAKGSAQLKRKVNRRVKIFSDKELKITTIPIPKFFSDRKVLMRIVSGFLNDLFLTAAKSSGNTIWVEKTPYNILHYSFIRELFPEALFIHIKRDPRSVAQSYFRQNWAPNSTENCAILLRNVYRKWFTEKDKIEKDNPNFLEVKLEDFVGDPQRILFEPIRKYLGLNKHFDSPQDLDLSKVLKAKTLLSSEERECVDRILKDQIIQFGYEL